MKAAAVVCLAVLAAATGGLRASDPAAGMQRISKLKLSDPAYRSLYCGVIDTANGFGYFSTADSVDPGRIIKVDLRWPVPVEVGAAACLPGESHLISGAIDPAAGYAYFGTTHSPGKVIKIALGAGASAPSYVGSINLAA